MMKSRNAILISGMIVALQFASEGHGSDGNGWKPATATSPPAENLYPAREQPLATGTAQAVSHLGGIWAGKALIFSAPLHPPVEVAARGLVAADGTGYFLVHNTVLSYTGGAPLVGTGLDFPVWGPGGYIYLSYAKQLTLDLFWCPHRSADRDICFPNWNRLALNYDRSYESGSSLARIAGHYVDTTGKYKGVLTIASDGYLFMQDPASRCVVSGRVTIINRTYNVYTIKLGYANCLSPTLNGVTFNGLVSYDGRERQLFALMTGIVAKRAAANMLAFRRQ